jgi:hypothetical protein
MGQSNGKIQFSTYLPVELHRGLKVAAAVAGVPISTIVEDLLVAHLDAYVAAKQAQKAKPKADQG